MAVTFACRVHGVPGVWASQAPPAGSKHPLHIDLGQGRSGPSGQRALTGRLPFPPLALPSCHPTSVDESSSLHGAGGSPGTASLSSPTLIFPLLLLVICSPGALTTTSGELARIAFSLGFEAPGLGLEQDPQTSPGTNKSQWRTSPPFNRWGN